MRIHVWPCSRCPVSKVTKKAIDGHEKSHEVKSK